MLPRNKANNKRVRAPPPPAPPPLTSVQYARYTCQVKSDDIDSDGVVGLQEKAVESGSGSALEALFANNGGVLSGVSVVGVEAEVMRDVYIVGSSVGELRGVLGAVVVMVVVSLLTLLLLLLLDIEIYTRICINSVNGGGWN